MSVLHRFTAPIGGVPLPRRLNNPFDYEPHPLCRLAAEAVREELARHPAWRGEVAAGKMFGVLVVRDPAGEIGFLAAFSGNLAGENRHDFFVPPVYDMLRPGDFFRQGEAEISALNRRIAELEQDPRRVEARQRVEAEVARTQQLLDAAREARRRARAQRDGQRRAGVTAEEAEAMIRASQHEKAELHRLKRACAERVAAAERERDAFAAEIERLGAERRRRSAALQLQLFEHFRMVNARGEVRDLLAIFAEAGRGEPPAGAGECAAPKLLQYAFRHGLEPLAMGEFWQGASPRGEVRRDGAWYPACRGKCAPILSWMLQGVATEPEPSRGGAIGQVEVLYDDEWLVAVDKPAGVLSVPGRSSADSMLAWARRRYSPEAATVHRLDMDTSGVLLIAKGPQAHRRLQEQFAHRAVSKRYVALLEGAVTPSAGRIELPLCADPADRPRQQVHPLGRPAVTEYRVVGCTEGRTRVEFHPLTGRTHQLRVHAAHPDGLDRPIAGDPLYGHRAERLYLHAAAIEFRHPATGEPIRIESPVPF